MKRLLTTVIAFVAFVAVAVAQTPEEIIARMETELNQYEKSGVIMTVDMKLSILGTMTTKTYSLDQKTRMENTVMGIDMVTWTDGVTMWMYNSKNQEVEINDFQNKSAEADAEGDIGMFNGITEGYDVSIDKETPEAWYIYCKKSKSNTDKDAPKKMDLVIAKETYMPISLTTKMDGIKITMRDISFGVTEEQVTFDPAEFPGVKIVDKRKK